jgi:TonB family protein
MRVLVVDQDSALLTEITQMLGEYFAIDAVTNKADCLDLVRINEFEVIVAGERLQDGSGLELLAQLARSRPDMLRIFAADRERLKLLKGRLGPFGLFRTLSYPIEPRQLLAALSAAAGFDEEPLEESPAPETPQPAARASIPTPAVASAPTHSHAPARPQAPTLTVTASQQPSPMRRPTSGGPGIPARNNPYVSGPTRPHPRVPRQPTPTALALGARIATASRPQGYPPPRMEPSAKRSAFLVGAGVVVIVGAIGLAFRLANTSDAPAVRATTLSPPTTPSFPPEVLKLIADTETAIQNDDFKAARTDIAALHQIAPTHPRLPFLESLLGREEMASNLARPPAESTRLPARRVASRKVATTPGTVKQPERMFATTPSTGSLSSVSTSPATTSPKQTPAVAIFGGRTIEEDTGLTAGPSSLTTASEATAAPVSHTTSSGSSVTEVRLVQSVAAEYPEDARRDGIEGAVDLRFAVSAGGEVRDVTITHAEPSSIFNRAAIAAVHRWIYQPKTVNGIPVEAHVQVRLTFKLDRGR